MKFGRLLCLVIENKTLALLAALGGGLVAVTVVFQLFLDISSSPEVSWYVFAASCGVVLFSIFSYLGAAAFGALTMLYFLAGASQLMLTEPLWFTTIKIPRTSADVFHFLVVGFQAIISFGVLKRTVSGDRLREILASFEASKLIIFFGLTALFTVSPLAYFGEGRYAVYALKVTAGFGVICANLLTIAAILTTSPPKLRVPFPSIWVLSCVSVLASALLCWFGFERMPHVEDEVAYVLQAKTFAAGALSAPAPPEALHLPLEYYLMDIRDARWFSAMPPGWPVVLSLGFLTGWYWLVNPILAGLSVLVCHNVVRRLYSKNVADITAGFLAVSPLFLGISGSLMSHGTAIFSVLMCWWCLLRTVERGSAVIIWSLLAGLFMGWVFVTRPIDGVVLGVLTGVLLVVRILTEQAWLRVVFYSLGCVVSGSLFLLYNFELTGDFFTDPLTQYYADVWSEGSNAYGFGPDIGPPELWGKLDLERGHSPYEGILNTVQNFATLQFELSGWGIGSLVFLFASFLWGRLGLKELALLSSVVVLIAATFFYWFSGGFYLAARYWSSALIPILIFSALGFKTFSKRVAELGGSRDAVRAVVAVLCTFSLLVFTPWRGVTKYNGYGEFSSEIATELEKGYLGTSVVFFDIDADPGSGFYLNDPFLRSPHPLFLPAGERKIESAIMDALPDRTRIDLRFSN